MAEDFVNKIDLDGEQWDLQDTKAQELITELKAILPDMLESIFTANFDNSKFSIPSDGRTVVAQYTGFYYGIITKTANNSSTVYIEEDGYNIAATDMATSNTWVSCFSIFIRKGRRYRFNKQTDSGAGFRNTYFIPFNFG